MPDKNGNSVVDEVFAGKRKSDNSTAAKVSRFIVRYSPIIVFLYSIMVWWLLSSGFGWNTPKEKLETVNIRVDSLVSQNRDAREVRDRILDVLEILSIKPCMDLRRQNDPYIYRRLRCDEILRGVS